MGGKAPYAPIRYGYTSNSSYVQSVIPTDLYFSELNSNWKQGNDNYYGLIFNITDYAPELAVGRLLCKNRDEISNYSDKLIRYELNPGNGNYTYLRNALITECDFMQTDMEGETIRTHISPIFNNITFYKEISDYNPTGKNVIDSWNNNQYGYVSLHGHGNPYGIAINYVTVNDSTTGMPNSISSLDVVKEHLNNETGNGLDNLNNKDYPSVLYSVACEPMPFDIFTSEKGEVYNKHINFGESFTLGKNYGGVAFLGNTRDGYQYTSVELEETFLNSLKKYEYRVGVAEADSKFISNNVERHIRLAHNLLGDPEFEMWSYTPSKYNGIIVTRTDNSITVSGFGRTSNKTVAYCSNGEVQGKVETRASSVTFNNVSPNSSIMVYQHNRIPYIAPLYLQNETINYSQYVFASTLSAGRNVDSNRTSGNIVFASGVNYEVEATGNVSLGSGLIVKNGATLKIMTPGTVTINGATVERGGKVIIEAGSTHIPLNFNAMNGSSVKIEKYTPIR
jgi:hypothetical protein